MSERHSASYFILGVKHSSTSDEIKTEFLRQCKIYHPDNTVTGNRQRFLRLKDAFDRIKDAPLSKKHSQIKQYNCPEVDFSYEGYIKTRSHLGPLTYTKASSTSADLYGSPGLKSFRRFHSLLNFLLRNAAR